MKWLIIMLTLQLNYSLLLFSLFSMVRTFPTAPLNERNKEVSWEAWLLVDDQKQNLPAELESPKRRIVPKSIFFAQTFSPESLAPCGEGHDRNEEGKCVKVIKLDEDRHFEFLFSKLQQQFGSLDYDTEFEPNSEPTRVDIPLGGDYEGDYTNDKPEEELGMAIIVTPTTRDSGQSSDDSKLGKRDDKLSEDTYEDQLKLLKSSSSSTTEKVDFTTIAPTTETASETTTHLEETTTTVKVDSETTMLASSETTTDHSDLLTIFTDAEDVPESTTTSEQITTTVTELPITESTTVVTTTTPKITTYHPVATTYHPNVGIDWSMPISKIKNLVKFPTEDVAIPRSHLNGNYVRFPDMDGKMQQESVVHRTRDVNDQTGNFFNEIVTPQPSERVQDVVMPPKGHVAGFYDNHRSKMGSATTEKHPMKKAKQSLFQLPPDWSPQDPKPIVLRSLPVEDLTYLFGYKNGQSRQNR